MVCDRPFVMICFVVITMEIMPPKIIQLQIPNYLDKNNLNEAFMRFHLTLEQKTHSWPKYTYNMNTYKYTNSYTNLSNSICMRSLKESVAILSFCTTISYSSNLISNFRHNQKCVKLSIATYSVRVDSDNTPGINFNICTKCP